MDRGRRSDPDPDAIPPRDLLADFERVVGGPRDEMNARFAEHLDATYQRFDLLETEYHEKAHDVSRCEDAFPVDQLHLATPSPSIGGCPALIRTWAVRARRYASLRP